MQVPEKYKFIVKLGKALHTYGVPSYKSQDYLEKISHQSNIKGSFMDTPTWINYVFYDEDENSYNYVECVPPGELNLGALSRVERITKRVLANELSYGEAKVKIENIEADQISYGKAVELLAFMTSAGAFSIILNTSWLSALVSFLLGAVVFSIAQLAKKSQYITTTLESMVALTSTLITGVLASYFSQINLSMTILASIIVFIPGLSLTTALEEITSRSLVSGTAKLFDALVSLFKQFFGVALGLILLGLFIDLKPNDVINDVPEWVDYIAIILLTSSLLPVFKVAKPDVIYCILAGFISYQVTAWLDFSGLLLSIFIGTIVTVNISKLFSWITKSPPLVFLVPGIIMLVPGSKAFISLSSVLIDTGQAHSNMGEQVLYIFMGIIGGLIFSGRFIARK
jgi:uncharacterized membrane protein YjjP (DUF1212 family)